MEIRGAAMHLALIKSLKPVSPPYSLPSQIIETLGIVRYRVRRHSPMEPLNRRRHSSANPPIRLQRRPGRSDSKWRLSTLPLHEQRQLHAGCPEQLRHGKSRAIEGRSDEIVKR